MPTQLQVELDHGMRFGKRLLHIAVAVAEHCRLGGMTFVELDRLLGRGHQNGERVDLEMNGIRRVLRSVGIDGKHGSHRFADITHTLSRQHGLAVRQQGFG